MMLLSCVVTPDVDTSCHLLSCVRNKGSEANKSNHLTEIDVYTLLLASNFAHPVFRQKEMVFPIKEDHDKSYLLP